MSADAAWRVAEVALELATTNLDHETAARKLLADLDPSRDALQTALGICFAMGHAGVPARRAERAADVIKAAAVILDRG